MKQNEPITVDTQLIKIIRDGKASCHDARNWFGEKMGQTLINWPNCSNVIGQFVLCPRSRTNF